MKTKILFFYILIFCLCITGFADFDVSKWKFKKEIFLKDYKGEIAEIQLDTEILSNSRSDHADIRIIAENNKEIPYTISLKKEIKKITEYHPFMLNKSYIPGSHMLVEFDMGNQRVLHNCLVLDIADSNFTRGVEVLGKNNGKWYTLTTHGFIFDHTIPEAGVSARSTKVPYPLTDYRYIRVIIHGGYLDVTGAKLLKDETIPAQEIKYKINIVKTSETKDKNAIEYIIDTGVSGLPHYKLEVQTDQKNFHRRVVVYPCNDISDTSQDVSHYEDTIYSFVLKNYSEVKKSVFYPESNSRYLRVFLYHYDDQPLTVKNFNLYGIVRKVSFPVTFVKGKSRIFLYYGNTDARIPVYDFAKYQSYLKNPEIVECFIGNQENNEFFKPSPFERFEKNKKILLGVIMAIVAIVLGFFIIKNIKGITKNSSDTGRKGG